MEQLAYATRLNQASTDGQAGVLWDWLVAGDMVNDPQAFVLRPDVALAGQVVTEPSAYLCTRRAALAEGAFPLSKAESDESNWLGCLSEQAEGLPGDEATFIGHMLAGVDRQKVRHDQYGFVG
jgi:hypothetical protein